MSVQAVRWVRDFAPYRGACYNVSLALADWADADLAHIRPGLDRVIHATRMSRSGVLRALARLRRDGVLVRERTPAPARTASWRLEPDPTRWSGAESLMVDYRRIAARTEQLRRWRFRLNPTSRDRVHAGERNRSTTATRTRLLGTLTGLHEASTGLHEAPVPKNDRARQIRHERIERGAEVITEEERKRNLAAIKALRRLLSERIGSGDGRSLHPVADPSITSCQQERNGRSG